MALSATNTYDNASVVWSETLCERGLMSRRVRGTIAVVGMWAFAACAGGGDTAPNLDPLVVAIFAGGSQTATVGQAVATVPAVRATRGGNAAAGVAVVFSVSSGGGSITAASATTDATGVARVGSWILGTTTGTQTVTAQIAGATGSPLTFSATANAGNAATATKQSTDGQSGAAGVAVGTRPAVRVVDQYANPVSGATVNFAVVVGSGTISGGTQVTGTDGIATVGSWTLGQTAGANSLTATVQGTGVAGSPLTFTATAIAGAASTAAKQAGDAQSATVGTAVTVRPAVRVTDQFGNAVSAASVTFAVSAGGGTVSSATVATDATGVATVGSWTLGTVAGAHALSATVAGVTGSPLSFTATATAGAASVVTKLAGDAINSAVGAAVTVRPTIKVADAFGNAVAGVAVTFAVAGGTGVVTGAQQTTGADGSATVGSWTLGQLAGTNVLQATATGGALSGNPASFTATGIAGPATALVKQAGDLQTVVAGSALPIAPSVRLTDQFGNSILNQSVTFAIVSGGGTTTGASPVTGANGVATIGGWTLGAAPGANTLSATAGALNVTFTASALAMLNAAQFAGTYTGTWTNTTFGSTDVASANIVVNTLASNATVTIAASGNVLGTPGGIPATPRVTPYTASTAAFTGNVPQLGNIFLTFVSTTTPGRLDIVASGTAVPNGAITRWDAIGTITPTQISMTFTVTFVVGAPAVGTIVLNKP